MVIGSGQTGLCSTVQSKQGCGQRFSPSRVVVKSSTLTVLPSVVWL